MSPRKSESSAFRTWFTRVALAGWAVYALAILLFPLWDEAKERNRAFQRDTASYEMCKNVAAEHRVPAKLSQCDNVYQARLDRDSETYQFGSEYRAMGWRLAWVVPVALFVPPLIFFVVACVAVFGFLKLANWLRTGLDRGLARAEAAPAMPSEIADLPLARFCPSDVLSVK